jgi:hypothetical protein
MSALASWSTFNQNLLEIEWNRGQACDRCFLSHTPILIDLEKSRAISFDDTFGGMVGSNARQFRFDALGIQVERSAENSIRNLLDAMSIGRSFIRL